MNEARYNAAKKLMDAAHDFWKIEHEHGNVAAVKWLTADSGEMLIFTRSEFRSQLMRNIDDLPFRSKEHFFGEHIEEQENHGNHTEK